jgi:hypothetical protein
MTTGTASRRIRMARIVDSSGRRCPTRSPNRRAAASRSRRYSRKACYGDCRLPGSHNRCSGRRTQARQAEPSRDRPLQPSSSQPEELSFSWGHPLKVSSLTELDTPDKGFIPPGCDSQNRNWMVRAYGPESLNRLKPISLWNQRGYAQMGPTAPKPAKPADHAQSYNLKFIGHCSAQQGASTGTAKAPAPPGSRPVAGAPAGAQSQLSAPPF